MSTVDKMNPKAKVHKKVQKWKTLKDHCDFKRVPYMTNLICIFEVEAVRVDRGGFSTFSIFDFFLRLLIRYCIIVSGLVSK